MGWFIQFIPHGKESRCFINLFLLVWQGMVILLPAWDCGHYWLCSKRPDIKILERFFFFLRGKAALRFARTKTKRGVPIRSEANGLHVCMGTRGSDSSDWNPSFVSIDTSEDWCSHLDLIIRMVASTPAYPDADHPCMTCIIVYVWRDTRSLSLENLYNYIYIYTCINLQINTLNIHIWFIYIYLPYHPGHMSDYVDHSRRGWPWILALLLQMYCDLHTLLVPNAWC